MQDSFVAFLERGVMYIIEGQRTGQATMNAYRDLVEPWESFGGIGGNNVVTASGRVLPDIWEISGDDEAVTTWMNTAAEVLDDDVS